MRRIVYVAAVMGVLAGCSTPSIERRYEDWRARCLEYGYVENDPQLTHCIELQEREYQNVIIPWY